MAATVIPLHHRPVPTSWVPAWEAMRRSELRASINRLLAENARDGVIFLLCDDPAGLRVDAVVGTTRRQVAGPYREDRIEDFARVIRAGVWGWRQTLTRRASLTVVH